MFIRTESFREFIRFYPIVSLIVCIHIFIYILTALPLFPGRLIFETFAGVNLFVVQGEVWRLVTPIVLHGGFAHMLFNSFSLVLFGPGLERILGKGKFLLLYFFAGIIANLATLLLKPLTYTHVGSSGAIYGLFGFYLAIILFNKALLSRQNSQIILTIAAIGFVMTFFQPNINITAHFFGLLAGFIIGFFTYANKGNQPFQLSRPSFKGRRFSGYTSKDLILWGAIIALTILGLLASLR